MRNSQFVFIDSSCKSPDAQPELRKIPYFSLFRTKKIRISDVVTHDVSAYPRALIFLY